jgi:ATP-binding cassette subfamily B protein
VFAIIGPSLIGSATTTIFNGLTGRIQQKGSFDYKALGDILITLVLLYTLSSLLMFIQNFIMSTVVQKMSYTLRSDISEKIDRLPMKTFDQTTHGEILSRITNDIDTLSQNLGQGMNQSLASLATIIGVFVMMIRISLVMTLVAILLFPIALILSSTIIKRTQKLFVAQQKYLGESNGLIEEAYGGHDVIKAFNAEPDMQKKFERINGELFDPAWKSQFFSGLMGPIMMGIGDVGYVLAALFGGYLAIIGAITVGDIQAFIQYMRTFSQRIGQTAQVTGLFQSTMAAAERVFDFLALEEEHDHSEASLHEVHGSVAFDHVAFSYIPEKPVIRDFSIHIEQGQRIAIVGPTGAGKTTIVKLLMRFYDIDKGTIRIDNQDISSFSRSDVRRHMGMVLQDTWLFNGTIRDNIRYGRLDATEEEIIEAAKAARIDHVIQTLPGGYDMIINEESSNISQGQKQLITIARAFLSNPSILILDEATSSVDTRTEILVKEAITHLMHGRTSFIIAHRLSTIRDADSILVMRDGDVVEQGEHKTLLANNGFYAELYNAQFEAQDASV